MNASPLIFGEVLFDRFPDGRSVLGGAPFNVAWHLRAFGLQPVLISRVGGDADGAEVADTMRRWGMDLSGLQHDPVHATGRVDVRIEGGEPAYTIAHPAAWDAIGPPSALPDAPGLLYHGTLALREAASRDALEAIRAACDGPVFIDVNLRPPWWDRDATVELLDAADWVKLNEDELIALSPGSGTLAERASGLARRHGLRGLVVTRGAAGAMALEGGEPVVMAGLPRTTGVVDTVGAGDAFAAVVILGLLSGWPPGRSLERALAFAAAVCGLRGGTTADREFYRPFIDAWSLIDV